MLAVQILLTGIQSLVNHTILQSDTGHGTEALTLDKDFAFFALVRTNLIAVEVVGAQIPLAIPTMLLHGINHGINAALSTLGFLVLFDFVAKFHILFARQDEQTGNHQTFGLRPLAVVLSSLEALVRIP